MSTLQFKKGQKVNATTIRGKLPIAGTIEAIHETFKGAWYEIKPASGTANFRTRASKIVAA
jgi:hypothetical protein